MLNIDTIKNGLVIDHIKSGFGPQIFHFLGLDKAEFSCALIMNVSSKKTGKKDIIKHNIRCKNPRCITATENYIRPVFRLVNRGKSQYACEYCDALYSAGSID